MNLYGMQRANGHWFAIREPTRFRVPLFSSVDEARATRAFNVDLLVCTAVLFDERALKQVAELEEDRGVYFWLVDEYSRNMRRGTALEREEVERMLNDADAQVLTRD
jgi:hypothetical protein